MKVFDQKGPEIEQETEAAKKLIVEIINDVNTPSDNAALARIETRIDNAVNDLRHRMNDENAALLAQLDAKDLAEARRGIARIDRLRDEFNQKIDMIRGDMRSQVNVSAAVVIRNQQRAIMISAIVTALAAIMGLVFAMLVSGGITRSGACWKARERSKSGRLDRSIDVITRDEIGQLSIAFNRMVEQLRHNERIREIFGRYVDPKVVEGLIDQPALAATEGQRRIMTVMFCDMKGFTALSEGMTPQGLVKVMNRDPSTMSEQIRSHRGIIDKYIGDAIMAYWGPRFIE